MALLPIARLEDPAFTIKTVRVVTAWPGASAAQVKVKATLPLDKALQRLYDFDKIRSISGSGLSPIAVTLQSR